MTSMIPELSYGVVGLTRPGDEAWPEYPQGYHRYTATIGVGHGLRRWNDVVSAVMNWQVKISSGFGVESPSPGTRAREGVDYRLTVRLGPIIVHEPVRVVAVVD